MPATLRSRLPQIQAQLSTRMGQVAKQGAEMIAERAKQLVPDAPPIGEGLVDAIHVREYRTESHVVAGDDEHWYGHFLEFGTTRAAPQPFLIPAAEESIEPIQALAHAALRDL